MSEIKIGDMTEAEARKCAESIRGHIDEARLLVLELHDRRGWVALGYKNWAACVQSEFGQSKRHLYRQLEAAKAEKIVAPELPSGSIPERHLRPLAHLEPEQKIEAWKEAKKAAPNGKLTEKHVALASAAIAAPKTKPEHPDTVAMRVVAGLPSDAPVDIIDPETEPEAETAIADPEMTDEEWLAQCPAREKLTPALRRRFDLDALAYRRTSPARDRFRRSCKPITNQIKNEGQGHIGTWLDKHLYYVGRIKHPRQWVICFDCRNSDGIATGKIKLIGECPECRGNGYRV